MTKSARDAYRLHYGGPDMRLDYHECAGTDDLVRVLNDIVADGFLLEKVIPQPEECFVVLFRRGDLG